MDHTGDLALQSYLAELERLRALDPHTLFEQADTLVGISAPVEVRSSAS